METTEKPMPIKRNENLVPLSREHHFGLLFSWKIRQGVAKNISREMVKSYVRYFWEKQLREHLSTEERLLATLLFPKDAMRVQLEEEHCELENKISEILSGNNDSDKNLLYLADFLTQHIRFEEREMFPYLEQKFTPEQLAGIGDELMHRHAPANEEFTPEFWLRDYKEN